MLLIEIFRTMLLKSTYLKDILLFYIFLLFCVNGNKVKNDETNIVFDYNPNAEDMLCRNANLRMYVDENQRTRAIDVSFKMSEDKYKGCFPYFNIELHRNRKKVDEKVIPYNNETNQATNYTFENVSCGSYKIYVRPYASHWQPAPLRIGFPRFIRIECGEALSKSARLNIAHNSAGIQRKILMMCVIAISVALIIGIFVYYLVFRKKCHTGYHENIESKELVIENGEENSPRSLKATKAKKTETFIIHYSDEETLGEVEDLIQSIHANCLNTSCSRIGDTSEFSNFLISPVEYLDNKLKPPTAEDDVIRKIIVVDSARVMKDQVHENENAVFMEAIEKLYRNFGHRRYDYKNVFVVHYGHSRIKMPKLNMIVEGMRYHIPDNLDDLYRDLLTVLV